MRTLRRDADREIPRGEKIRPAAGRHAGMCRAHDYSLVECGGRQSRTIDLAVETCSRSNLRVASGIPGAEHKRAGCRDSLGTNGCYRFLRLVDRYSRRGGGFLEERHRSRRSVECKRDQRPAMQTDRDVEGSGVDVPAIADPEGEAARSVEPESDPGPGVSGPRSKNRLWARSRESWPDIGLKRQAVVQRLLG